MSAIPKYFYAFPKLASISNADSINTGPINYENPLKRERNNIKSLKGSSKNALVITSFPYPSSYFPDIFFKNTVPHPYLIFYNLHLLDPIIKNGDKRIGHEESVISQLNRYFGVTDILSITSENNDFIKISETWNNRFPDAKSSSFSTVSDDFQIKDLHDIQSLHTLAFQLNSTFYLIFKIDDNEDGQTISKYYNMKLGPDSSDFDIHFLVHDNIDKSGVTFKMRNKEKMVVFKHELWLSLELIEISKISGQHDTKFIQSSPKFDSKSGGVMFLELEKRDPIPFIQIPPKNDSDPFTSVRFYYRENSKEKIKYNILFKYSEGLNIYVFGDSKYINRINKIKSIVTEINDKAKKIKPEIPPKLGFEHFLLAQTNRSAFMVEKSSYNDTETNSALDVFQGLSDKLSFPPINAVSILDEINDKIISYRKRLKYPITYGQIASSKHPLIYILCTYNIIDMMLKSADYLNEDLQRNKSNDSSAALRAVPVENDDIFFTYKDYKDCVPTTNKDKIMDEWKKLADTYPQLMSPASLIYGNQKYVNDIKVFTQDDNPLFSYFYFYLRKNHSSFYLDHADTLQPISQKSEIHIMQNKVGLNPIVTPIIYREYMQLSKTCCIYYYSNRLYNKPVNEILMRDIQTVKECTSRTTVKLFKDIEVVEENANIGAFPIKKQSFLQMLEMKGSKQIPDPSFDFKVPSGNHKEPLLQAIMDSDSLEIASLEPHYIYKFYPIINGDIVYISQFSITSHYPLKYVYVSRGNVYSVGVDETRDLFAFGTCKTLDTEMQFDIPIEGKFIDAVYLEENSCLIICYKNEKGECCFTGYDEQGQINQSIIDFKDDVKSLTVLSRTFFASFNGSRDVEKGISVFKYNPKERRIEFNKYDEKWRISSNSYGRASLCKPYLQNEANRENDNYQPCFIGSQLSYGNKTSTFCIYKYDSDKCSLFVDLQYENPIQPNVNFSSEAGYAGGDDQSEENSLLEKRISNKGKQNVIPTMINLLPIKNKKNEFSCFELHCSLCELFPVPISINKRIVTYYNDLLSLYLCDHKIYRTLSNQIYGFYVNTLTRINLFSIEVLLQLYTFKNTQIVLIVDTCGIAAKFSNIFFGTRFEEKDILRDEIWAGFSYSKSNAAIIFILRIDDKENLYNAVNKEDIHPVIFYCKKDGIKYSIKLGYQNKNNKYKDLINIGNTNKASSRFTEITFVSNTEFQNNVISLKEQYDEFISDSPQYDSRQALDCSKDILARYLSYSVFEKYPLKTIEKYATTEPPKWKNIEEAVSKL